MSSVECIRLLFCSSVVFFAYQFVNALKLFFEISCFYMLKCFSICRNYLWMLVKNLRTKFDLYFFLLVSPWKKQHYFYEVEFIWFFLRIESFVSQYMCFKSSLYVTVFVFQLVYFRRKTVKLWTFGVVLYYLIF